MNEQKSFAEVVRALTEDPAYVKELTREIEARTVDQRLVEQLIDYARSRTVSASHAMARKILTDAGVSWEAVK